MKITDIKKIKNGVEFKIPIDNTDGVFDVYNLTHSIVSPRILIRKAKSFNNDKEPLRFENVVNPPNVVIEIAYKLIKGEL